VYCPAAQLREKKSLFSGDHRTVERYSQKRRKKERSREDDGQKIYR
jgi:hypothetical protein